MPLLMPLLTNKFVWIGLAFVAVITYYNIQVFALEHTVQGLEADVKNLQADIRVLKGNYAIVENTNKENISTIEQYKRDLNASKQLQNIITSGKDAEINSLKKIIKELRTVDVYPETLKFKECEVKVKRINDVNETNSSFSSILNIGI